MKSAALAVTTFGAYCLITRIDIDEIVGSTALGLFILVAASALCAVFVPEIGVDQSWMHNGQWQGIYESKQTLGFISAYLMFFACYRKMTGQGWIAFLSISYWHRPASSPRNRAAPVPLQLPREHCSLPRCGRSAA
ncbi:hypothetical protein ACVIU7_002290 [Bradyrhizobium liaoningense]|nr:hypothetical protein GCM10007858_27890 [Bradyrhizobium liaoningense]